MKNTTSYLPPSVCILTTYTQTEYTQLRGKQCYPFCNHMLILLVTELHTVFPGGSSGKEPVHQCRRCKRCGVQSLGWEDPLEKGMATHSNILAWKIPLTEGPGGLSSIGLWRVRHDWACRHDWTSYSLVAQMVKNVPAMQETWVGKIPWRTEWLPTSVFLARKFHDRGTWRAIVRGFAGLDMTEWLAL